MLENFTNTPATMPKNAFFVIAVTAAATMPSTGLGELATDVRFGTNVNENPIMNKNPEIDSAGIHLLSLFMTPNINRIPLITIINIPAINGQ